MKKSIIYLLVAVMLATMMFALTGCGGNNELVGKWKADVDLSEKMAAEGMNLKVSMPLVFEFSDKEMSVSIDENEFKSNFVASFKEYFSSDEGKELFGGITYEEYLLASGMTEEQFSEQLSEGMDFSETNVSGPYEVKNGQIICDDGAWNYELNGDTLTITDIEVDSDNQDGIAEFKSFMPLVFKRQ